MEEKVETLQVELQHLKEENSALRLMLEVLSSKYKTIQSQLQEINNKAEHVTVINNSNQSGSIVSSSLPINDTTTNKRPRLEFPTAKKPLQLFYRTDPKDDSLTIKDGYQWRKYGQKVTKDNASPRAYFRCSMAPSCPAKKKVQKCIHDKSIIVATYDGDHNHNALYESLIPSSSTPKGSMAKNNLLLPIITPNEKLEEAMISGWSKKDATLCGEDFIMQKIDHRGNIKIEEYASSLIKDPEFTAALAEAVARTITGQHSKEQGLNLNLGLSEQ